MTKNQRGYTLLEFMITVTILVIVVAIAIPKIMEWRRQKEEGVRRPSKTESVAAPSKQTQVIYSDDSVTVILVK